MAEKKAKTAESRGADARKHVMSELQRGGQGDILYRFRQKGFLLGLR